MTKELKPCPFCGGKAEIIKDEMHVWVHCTNCDSDTDLYQIQKEAVAAWNRRPILEQLEAENKRLREALEHAVTTDTTVDKWGIWRIDGKTFQTWVADVLKGGSE